jgi:cephalosporin hydroxylase
MAGVDTINLSWLGHQTLKCPLDLWIYQELMVRTRPDVIIETGTAYGGSALFMASVFDLIGHGEVISIDVGPNPARPRHPRIDYVLGSSTDPELVAAVTQRVSGRRVMVVLDSDHGADHVYGEMVAYSPLVPVGGYLIVEDTNINGHPTFEEFGPGPMEAVDRFLAASPGFAVDERCTRFMMTLTKGLSDSRPRPGRARIFTCRARQDRAGVPSTRWCPGGDVVCSSFQWSWLSAIWPARRRGPSIRCPPRTSVTSIRMVTR